MLAVIVVISPDGQRPIINTILLNSKRMKQVQSAKRPFAARETSDSVLVMGG